MTSDQRLAEENARRLAEAARKQIALDVQEARQQFAQGKCQPATADELMREIMK
jgi:hypothetical protein